MDGELTRNELTLKIAELAFAEPGDAVRLALAPETETAGLDLRLVSEIKRDKNGALELRLMDRQKLIELLLELTLPEESQGSENLYTAIDSAAKALKETPDAL
ncbi:MAG: hypothetical protein RR314_04665 [Oscillospiraceae bacterium]